jgi:hypothetical protein
VVTKNQETQQFIRTCNVVVFSNQAGPFQAGLDLSALRIKFSIKRSNTATPNVADIRIYNMSDETANQIGKGKEYSKVLIQGGYNSNYGVLFDGNIFQAIIGRESAQDTFVDIVAGDGDLAYNFAVVNATLAKGSTQADQVNAAVKSMTPLGVTAGAVSNLPPAQLPRGKVMFGPAKNYLKNSARVSNCAWSIQDGKVTFVPKSSYLPGERVVLTSKTGMIGTPQQTNIGVNVKCLINPNIKVGGLIQIDNASIAKYKINLQVPNSPANIAPPLTADGVYQVLTMEHTGDSRGIDWYSTLVCINMDVTANSLYSVQTNYG